MAYRLQARAPLWSQEPQSFGNLPQWQLGRFFNFDFSECKLAQSALSGGQAGDWWRLLQQQCKFQNCIVARLFTLQVNKGSSVTGGEVLNLKN